MNITDWIKENDPSLELHSEGEWSGMVGSDQWSAFNDGGIECETGEFLYGLIRLIKAEQVLETGTHKGIGASYMAKALKDNGKGHLTTIEFLPELYAEALKRIQTLDLGDYVTSVFGDVKNHEPQVQYDLILLDTEPDIRYGELVKFYEHLKPGGFVFIHDLHRHMSQTTWPDGEHPFGWPFGVIPDSIKDKVAAMKLRPFHFTTPRGFTGFYKEHEGDFKWPISKQ